MRNQRAQVYALLREQIESLRAISFEDADLSAGPHSDPNNPIDTQYRRVWEVQDDTPVPGMKRVTVRVSFTSTTADSQAVVVTQIVR